MARDGTAEEPVEPHFADHVRELWSNRIAALVVALLASGAVYVWRANVTPRYEATATVLVRPSSGPVLVPDEAELLARTYAELAEGPVVLAASQQVLGDRGELTA